MLSIFKLNTMQDTKIAVELLFEKAKTYSQTSFELWKYQVIDRSSEIVSDLTVKIVIGLLLVIATTMINIAFALYLGELFGKIYFGFLAISGLYFVLAIFVLIFKKKLIKFPVRQFVINQILK